MTQHRFVTKNECGQRTEKLEIGNLPIIVQYPISKFTC